MPICRTQLAAAACHMCGPSRPTRHTAGDAKVWWSRSEWRASQFLQPCRMRAGSCSGMAWTAEPLHSGRGRVCSRVVAPVRTDDTCVPSQHSRTVLHSQLQPYMSLLLCLGAQAHALPWAQQRWVPTCACLCVSVGHGAGRGPWEGLLQTAQCIEDYQSRGGLWWWSRMRQRHWHLGIGGSAGSPGEHACWQLLCALCVCVLLGMPALSEPMLQHPCVVTCAPPP